MFIAMNRFQVTPGKEEEFEEIWRRRESYLDGVAGFVRFALLKSEMTPGEYVSHSTWKDRQSFVDWTQSEAFQAATGRARWPASCRGHLCPRCTRRSSSRRRLGRFDMAGCLAAGPHVRAFVTPPQILREGKFGNAARVSAPQDDRGVWICGGCG